MIVDNTILFVALKHRPHPSDAGSGLVCAKGDERKAAGPGWNAKGEERTNGGVRNAP